ncbi:MAG: hypothetical protein WAS51_14385 [Ilumatobacteraceae bacterium]
MTGQFRGLHAQFKALFADKEDLTITSAATRDDVFAYLDGIGEDSVLEFVASGRLVAELAIFLEFPILYVQEWVDTFIDKSRLRSAERAAAQSCVLKAQLALQVTPESPQEAQAMRAMSEHMTWTAERLDADRWGPPKKAVDAPPPVSIVFNMPSPPPQLPAENKAPEFARIIEHVPGRQ